MPSPWTSNLFQDRRGPARASRTRAHGGLARYLFVALLPLVLGPLITFALLAYQQAQADITRQVTAQLTSIATLKQNQVDQWATSRAVDMDNLARSPDILWSAQTLVFGDAPNMGTASQALRDRLESYLANTSNADFKGLLLTRADTGEVVLATSLYQPLVGEVLKEKTYLEAARNGLFLAPPLYDPQLDSERIVIVAGAPVVDQQQGFIAVVLGIIRDEQLLGIVQPNPGLGNSGRAYVVTHQGYQLGMPFGHTNFRPESEGIQRALRDHQNGNATYADPEGRRVLGVYRWLPRFGLALLVEQSATEAYQPITRLAFILALIALLAILVSSAGVFLFTRQLTRPIEELTDGALRMAGGDLSGRVMIQRGDEIGLLAQAFNSMAEQLQASYQDLEDKIESRTRQLETAAEVGRAVSSIVSSEELLS
ncbi:MAG: HAMP domain-containing protein, partial [Anaerolineales bacterium]